MRNALQGLGGVRFVSDKELDFAARAFGLLSKFGIARETASFIASAKPVLAAAMGIPAEQPIRGTYWRLRREPPQDVNDPIEAGAGVMWVSPVLPMRGEDARRVMQIVEPIFAAHGFEPMTTFTMITERSMVAVLNVYFDKREGPEVRHADECHHALVEALIEEGYIPYRAGLSTMPMIANADDVFWDVAAQIKRALDPGDIISRGRYLPSQQ